MAGIPESEGAAPEGRFIVVGRDMGVVPEIRVFWITVPDARAAPRSIPRMFLGGGGTGTTVDAGLIKTFEVFTGIPFLITAMVLNHNLVACVVLAER